MTLSSVVYFIKSYNTYNIVDINFFTRKRGEQIIHVERERERERERENPCSFILVCISLQLWSSCRLILCLLNTI